MANVIIHSAERQALENRVASTFYADSRNPEHRDAVSVIAARSAEAYDQMKRMEGN